MQILIIFMLNMQIIFKKRMLRLYNKVKSKLTEIIQPLRLHTKAAPLHITSIVLYCYCYLYTIIHITSFIFQLLLFLCWGYLNPRFVKLYSVYIEFFIKNIYDAKVSPSGSVGSTPDSYLVSPWIEACLV